MEEKVMTYEQQIKVALKLIGTYLPVESDYEHNLTRMYLDHIEDYWSDYDFQDWEKNLAMGFALVRTGLQYLDNAVFNIEECSENEREPEADVYNDTSDKANRRWFKDRFNWSIWQAIDLNKIDSVDDLKNKLKGGDKEANKLVCKKIARLLKEEYNNIDAIAIQNGRVLKNAAEAIAISLEARGYGMIGYEYMDEIEKILEGHE